MSRPRTLGYVARAYPQLTQTFVTNEVEAMRARGHRVLVAGVHRGDATDDADVRLLRGRPSGPGAWARTLWFLARHPVRLGRAVVATRPVRGEFGRGGTLVSPVGLAVVAAEWDRHGVELVHAHFAWEGAAAAMALSRLLDVPWTVTVHANDMYAAAQDLDAKLADADRVVTVCRYNRDELVRNQGLTGPIDIVICGVHPVESTVALDDRDREIVVVARHVEKKGLDVALRALALLEGHDDVTLRLIGDGPDSDALRALAGELGIAERVVFAGEQPHDAVLARIARCAVVVAPFRIARDGDRDSMPVVVKEAMVRRTPVVGTDVVGIPEMLRDGCGVVVPVDDPAALSSAITAVLDGTVDVPAMVDRAEGRATADYLLDTSAARLESVFDDVIARRGTSGR